MRPWRTRLFVAMARNEGYPAAYYALPDERTVTIGSLVDL